MINTKKTEKKKKSILKSRKTKNQNKKSILKSRKAKIQKGGDDITLAKIKELLSNVQNPASNGSKAVIDLPNVLGLMTELFRSKDEAKTFRYEYNVPFPFANKILESPTSYYEWYVSKNKGFTNAADVLLPEYEPLVMGMCKDLCVIHFVNHMPKPRIEDKELSNNSPRAILFKKHLEERKLDSLRKKSLEILKEMNGLIGGGYKYENFVECLIKYLLFFSVGDGELPKKTQNDMVLLLRKLGQSFFILLPTFYQINYYKVINSCAAPVLNFRITNSLVIVHGGIELPIEEVFHDITFHSKQTHDFDRFVDSPFLGESKDIVVNPAFAKEIFEEKKDNLQQLYKHYVYDLKNISSQRDQDQYLFACLLFHILHEEPCGDGNFSKESLSNCFDELFYKITHMDEEWFDKFKSEFMFKGKPEFVGRMTQDKFNDFYNETIKPILHGKNSNTLKHKRSSQNGSYNKYMISNKNSIIKHSTHNPRLFNN